MDRDHCAICGKDLRGRGFAEVFQNQDGVISIIPINSMNWKKYETISLDLKSKGWKEVFICFPVDCI